MSNMNIEKGDSFRDAVQIYDSARVMRVSHVVKQLVCSFFKPNKDELIFDVANVQGQTDGSSCGLFAIAFATELVHNCNPVVCNFGASKILRCHLIDCLKNGYMTRFPSRVRKTKRKLLTCVREKIYCIYKMPNDPNKSMIRCDTCLRWFHGQCVSINCENVKIQQWKCSECIHTLKGL